MNKFQHWSEIGTVDIEDMFSRYGVQNHPLHGMEFKLPPHVATPGKTYILHYVEEIPEDKYGNKFIVHFTDSNGKHGPIYRYMKEFDLIPV